MISLLRAYGQPHAPDSDDRSRVTGVQHPAPTLVCYPSHSLGKVHVVAPFATPVLLNGTSLIDPHEGKPRTRIWIMLYAQVMQADGESWRNVLLNHRHAETVGAIEDERAEVTVRPSRDVFGHATFNDQEIQGFLAKTKPCSEHGIECAGRRVATTAGRPTPRRNGPKPGTGAHSSNECANTGAASMLTRRELRRRAGLGDVTQMGPFLGLTLLILIKQGGKTMDVPPEMIAAVDDNASQLLSLAGITGIDIGFTEVNGIPTENIAIRVSWSPTLPISPTGYLTRWRDSLSSFLNGTCFRKLTWHALTLCLVGCRSRATRASQARARWAELSGTMPPANCAG